MIARTDKWGEQTASELLGEILLLCGHPDKAIKEYKQAIRLNLKNLTEQMGNVDELISESVGDLYFDLGLVYTYLSRPEQAKNFYQKALPHMKSALPKDNRWETDQDTIWRSEGRARHRVALLYEFIDSSDERVKQQLEQAVFVFEKTGIFEEDDAFEEIEYKRALEDLGRVRKREAWKPPESTTLAEIRINEKVMSFRQNWGVNLNKPPRRRQRGRA